MPSSAYAVGEEIVSGLAEGRAVVAMESTIYSGLGLPTPANEECLQRCERAIRAEGAIPALTAVIDGVARIGVEPHEVERVLHGSTKIAARDLGFAYAAGLPAGVTTVSAAVTLAAAAGVPVFATGGIGGVHRGASETGDISHDLVALSRHPVVTVSAGAKAFLDLPRTLEQLETLGVPVVGWQTDRFPAFYTRDSGLSLPAEVSDAEEVAAMFAANARLAHPGGVLVANPIPEADELDAKRIDSAIEHALRDCSHLGVRGPGVTPVVLAAIAEATHGESVPANLALAENNARVAAQIAVAIAAR